MTIQKAIAGFLRNASFSTIQSNVLFTFLKLHLS